MASLSAAEINSELNQSPGWQVLDGSLVRQFVFPDFVAAVRFVNDIAELAELAGHHPDIDVRYNKVRLALVTHDAGGITQRDFDFARAVAAIR